MERVINVHVNGEFARKDAKNAGVMGEANASSLHVVFDESWDGYAKRIVWLDARGEHPVAMLLAHSVEELLTGAPRDGGGGGADPRAYDTPVPAEALGAEGWCSFTLQGYREGEPDSIALTVTEFLLVKPNADYRAPAEPTPTQAQQLQAMIEGILPQVVESTREAVERSETAAEAAEASAGEAADSAAAAADDAESTAADREAAQAAAEAAALSEKNAAASETAAAGSAGTAEYWAKQAEEIVGGDYPTRSEMREAIGTAKSEAVDEAERLAKAAEDSAKAASVPLAQKGQPGGVPALGEDGKVPRGQLPVTGLLPQLIVPAIPGDTVTCTKGEVTFTAVAGEDRKAVFNVPDYGYWTVSNVKATRYVPVSEVRQYDVHLIFRYGYRVKKSEPDPEARVEYLYDAAGMRPAKMDYDNDSFDFGSWGNAWFVKDNFPCMLYNDDAGEGLNGTVAYRLNPNDYTKKEDGTASDVANTAFPGNAMSAIPAVWVNRYEETVDGAGYECVIFSNVQYDENYKAYAHTDASGAVKDYAYAPMFKGSLIYGKLRSLSGRRPEDSLTEDAEVTYAKANGSGWNILYNSIWQLIGDLCTLISKSDNGQAAFGQGHTTGGSHSGYFLDTGTLKDKGQFYGTRTSAAMKVFHLENWWGDRYDRMLGFMYVGNVCKVKMTPEGNGYNFTGDGYDTVPGALTASPWSYIKDSICNEYGRIPHTGGGSDATYECDALESASGTNMAIVSGACNADRFAGLAGPRLLSIESPAGFAWWNIGASLTYV